MGKNNFSRMVSHSSKEGPPKNEWLVFKGKGMRVIDGLPAMGGPDRAAMPLTRVSRPKA